MKSYDNYRKEVNAKLSVELRKDGKYIPKGKWQERTYEHIPPLTGRNCRVTRAEALRNYIGVNINETFLPTKKHGGRESLHPYVHHLNSSQLLCYMTFSKMLNNDRTPKKELVDLFSSLGLNISPEAQCLFEYCDDWRWPEENEAEGTSFDFYIKDGGNEFLFEVKFTEDGFGKASNDDRHVKKIKEVYMPKMVSNPNPVPTIESILKNYQFFRNVLRSVSHNQKVIFVTDENNVATKREIDKFKKDFPNFCHDGVIFKTWQEICAKWPNDLVKPFQFVCFEE